MVNLFKMAFNELSMQCIDLFLDNFCIDLKIFIDTRLSSQMWDKYFTNFVSPFVNLFDVS